MRRLDLDELSAAVNSSSSGQLRFEEKMALPSPTARSERSDESREREQEISLSFLGTRGRVRGRGGGARAARSRPCAPTDPRPAADRFRSGLVSRRVAGREARRVRVRPRRQGADLAQADAGRRRAAADGGSGRPAALLARRQLPPLCPARGRRDIALSRGRPGRGAAPARRQRDRRFLVGRRPAARMGARGEGEGGRSGRSGGVGDAAEPREVYRSNWCHDWPAWSPTEVDRLLSAGPRASSFTPNTSSWPPTGAEGTISVPDAPRSFPGPRGSGRAARSSSPAPLPY